jgi:DNA-binding response OmpR family regulator
MAEDARYPAKLTVLRILLVEDDASIGPQIVRGIEREGHQVTWVQTGEEALVAPLHHLVLLDLGLPDLDGLDVCRRLRADTAVPIIVLTARGDEGDRVAALDLGADDYLVKPFGLRELSARIRAVTRRTFADLPSVLRCGRLLLDERGRRAFVDDAEVTLTGKEFDILVALVAEPGETVSREDIFSRVWDEHWYGPRKVLDVHIASLRRKLGDPALIETVYGRGFRVATS